MNLVYLLPLATLAMEQAGRQRQSNGQANYCLQSLTASLQVTNLLKKPDTDWVFTADYSHKVLPIPNENINHTLTISFFAFWLFNINLLGIDNLKYQWARKSSVGDCKSTNLYKAPFTQFCPWDQTTVQSWLSPRIFCDFSCSLACMLEMITKDMQSLSP